VALSALNPALDESANQLVLIHHQVEPEIHVRLEIKGRHGGHIRTESADIVGHILGPRTMLGNITIFIHVLAAQLDEGDLVFIRQQTTSIDSREIEQSEIAAEASG